MATEAGASPPIPLWQRPWPLILTGLGTAVAALLLAGLETQAVTPMRLALLLTALLLAGVAVLRQLRHGVRDSEDRLEPTCLLAVAALVAFIAYLALDPNREDSGRMLTVVLGMVALLGAILVALPTLVRKIVVSLIILFHFGGILTAVTSQQPGEAQPPWLAVQAWGHIYHPYLQFFYLTNAYHFYSPEPGPATLLWFRVQYASGHSRWVKLPSRAGSAVPIHYIRNLAMAETINNFVPTDPLTFEKLLQRRQQAGTVFGIPMYPIQDMPLNGQYRRPSDYAQMLTASYARHIARTSPNPEDANDPVVSVKLYRVTHRILKPEEVARGMNPIDKTTYYAYYCGEYDTEGKLEDPNDPFLFWLIPILYHNGSDHPDQVDDYVEKQSMFRAPEKLPEKRPENLESK